MAQTKKQEEEVKEAMKQSPLKDNINYLFTIQGCPGYKGYIPNGKKYEVCMYCGQIKYYH